MKSVHFLYLTITDHNRRFSLILDFKGTNSVSYGLLRGQVLRLDILVCQSYYILHQMLLFQSVCST